ncbi:hypothetical protein D1627_12775 [Pontibacter oryzae]|uniref:Uncharacterized protein n=2 Tax=Pontibacter oryzae TaxID=2304593 RepID=A0A399S476_9BACT|nr:hypothetical protein D1627_12775 [Pontibacter oryzae]
MLALMGTMFSFSSCEKDMDTYDFSNSMPAYVEIKSKANIEVEEEKTASITFQSREFFQQDKTLKYEVTGAFTKSGTVTLARNTNSITLNLPVPANVVPAGQTSATATLTLVEADGLSVGRKGSDKEKVVLQITPKL